MAEFNFDPFLTGGAGDFAGQVGGYDIGAQPTPTVTAQPEFTGSATQYAPETTFQMPTEMPTFAAYDPTFAFQPTVTAPTAYAAPQNQFAGPISQPAISPALQRAYTSSAQPLPDIIRQFAGPAGTSATGGLYAAPSEAATPDAAQAGGGLSDILKSLGGVKGLTSIAGGLMGYLANQKAQQQAQDIGDKIKAAYQSAAGQTRQLAQPYITAGAPQLSMALQGALGPAQQQIYQAQQAQLAQAAAKTGGVGAIQTAAAEQQMYQRALQEQQAMALQLLSPGDQLLSQAISQELQGTTDGLSTTLQYQTMANEAAAKLFQQLGGIGASSPQSQTNPGVA